MWWSHAEYDLDISAFLEVEDLPWSGKNISLAMRGLPEHFKHNWTSVSIFCAKAWQTPSNVEEPIDQS